MNKRVLLLPIILLMAMACTEESIHRLEVRTVPVSDIFFNTETGFTEVTVEATMSGDTSAVTEKGFIWSKGNKFDFTKSVVPQGKDFEIKFTELDKNVTYYIKAFAIADAVCYYGEQISFVSATLPVIEDVSEYETSVTGTTAVLKGKVTSNGGASLDEYGVYLMQAGAADKERLLSDVITESVFEIRLGELQPATQYEVCFFAKNAVGEVTLDPAYFTTKEVVLPTVGLSSPAVTAETPTSMTLKALVSGDGNDPAVTCGFRYGLSATGLSTDVPAELNAEDNSFTASISGLESGTQYYFAAYAKNVAGEAVTEPSSHTTMMQTPPSVEMKPAVMGTDYDDQHITVKAQLLSNGGMTLTEFGFYMGKAGAAAQKFALTEMDADGNFTIDFDADKGVTPATKYEIQAFAVNDKGETKTSVSVIATGVADTRDGGELYLRNATMAKTTTRLVYWEMDPIEIDVDGDGNADEKIVFLDRNLGATELPASSARVRECVGTFFLWGSKAPQASYQMADMVFTGTVNKLNGWNGWGNQEYYTAVPFPDGVNGWNTLAENGLAMQPCPQGYRLPAAAEMLAAFKAKGVTDMQGMFTYFNFCMTGDFAIAGAYADATLCHIWTDIGRTDNTSNPTAEFVSSANLEEVQAIGRKRAKVVRCVRVEAL